MLEWCGAGGEQPPTPRGSTNGEQMEPANAAKIGSVSDLNQVAAPISSVKR